MVAGADSIDNRIIEVHGYSKQGSGYGYSGIRGLNALLATVSTSQSAPVVVAQRLRKGSCWSPRGAGRLIPDALKTVASLSSTNTAKALVRADSAFYGHAIVRVAIRGGAEVSVTVRMDPQVKAAICAISEDAWTTLPVHRRGLRRADPDLDLAGGGRRDRVHRVHLQEEGRAGPRSARGAPDPGPQPKSNHGQETLFDTWRFDAFFTTTSHWVADTVSADKTHRGHAIIEQVHADLKHSALAHLPLGNFTTTAAWLVLAVMAFNLTRGPPWLPTSEPPRTPG